jgi:hypothetical protein
MNYVEGVIDAGESTAGGFIISGNCDVVVEGLTAGSIKLQYKLRPSPLNASPDWKDFPDGSFTEDTFKTLYISSAGVYGRLTSDGGNDGVYVKISREVGR